jgi:hypothetical protein
MKRILIVIAVSLSFACGGMTPRAKLVNSHQSIETLLATVDDAERILCFGSVELPRDPTRCTTDLARQAKLTDEKHRAIRLQFIKAYEAQIRLGRVIATWVPGTQVNMDTAVDAVAEISYQLSEMNSSIPDLSFLIKNVKLWLEELNRMKEVFGGAK